ALSRRTAKPRLAGVGGSAAGPDDPGGVRGGSVSRLRAAERMYAGGEDGAGVSAAGAEGGRGAAEGAAAGADGGVCPAVSGAGGSGRNARPGGAPVRTAAVPVCGRKEGASATSADGHRAQLRASGRLVNGEPASEDPRERVRTGHGRRVTVPNSPTVPVRERKARQRSLPARPLPDGRGSDSPCRTEW